MNGPRPGQHAFDVVRSPPGSGAFSWAGAPSSAHDGEGGVALAYRVRHGVEGTDENVVATSRDGVHFDTVAVLPASRFGASMVERPTLLRTPEGRWRLYVCCNYPEAGSWGVEVLEAADLAGLATAPARAVFAPDPLVTVKDPVVQVREDGWHAWLCCHPLDVPGADDRMRTAYATSRDGLEWDWHGMVLEGRPGTWDARGARVTCVLPDGSAYYDGRASREENWFERSGRAVPAAHGGLVADEGAGVVDVRYVDALALGDGSYRLYYEARRPDGSHELRTELCPAGSGT